MSVLGQELRPVLERCPRDTPSLCAKWVRLRQVGETLRQVRETAPSLVRRDMDGAGFQAIRGSVPVPSFSYVLSGANAQRGCSAPLGC